MTNNIIRCLLLVRLGQELGTDTEIARAVFALVSAFAKLCS
jgi:hypothetical protein